MTTTDLVLEHIDPNALADYLTADSGCQLGLYADGKILVGPNVGNEIAPAERPVAVARCPGIGNVDMAWWRNGWDCDHLSDEQVIRQSCQDGDIEDPLADLVGQLIADAQGADR